MYCVCRWFLVPKLVGFPLRVGPTKCLSVQTTCCSCHLILVYLGLSATIPTSLGSATQLVKGRQGSYLETAAKVRGLRFRKSFDLGICHHPPIHLHVDAGGKNIHGAIWIHHHSPTKSHQNRLSWVPLPVGAMPKTSRPHKALGHTWQSKEDLEISNLVLMTDNH